jgi:hypothetical protein
VGWFRTFQQSWDKQSQFPLDKRAAGRALIVHA